MTRLLVIFLLATALAGAAVAGPDESLEPIGGAGGSPFAERCPEGEVLTGMTFRTGDWIDAIRPVCGGASGHDRIGAMQAHGAWHGGTGGGPGGSVTCPDGLPVVIAMQVASWGKSIISVSEINLYCGQAVAAPQRATQVTATFHVKFTKATSEQHCPSGLVAVGINGRSGNYLDAVGLICSDMSWDTPVKKLGRVQGAPATPHEARPICDVAKYARARNSAAAPGLEAQCRAHLAALAVEVAPIDPTGGRPHPAYDEPETSIPIIPPTAPEAPPTELPPPGRPHGVRVQGGVRYDYPHIRDQNGEFGLLSWCRELGTECGQPAAGAFCQMVEHGKRPYASAISKFAGAGRFRETVIISSRDACADKACDAFVSIVCTK